MVNRGQIQDFCLGCALDLLIVGEILPSAIMKYCIVLLIYLTMSLATMTCLQYDISDKLDHFWKFFVWSTCTLDIPPPYPRSSQIHHWMIYPHVKVLMQKMSCKLLVTFIISGDFLLITGCYTLSSVSTILTVLGELVIQCSHCRLCMYSPPFLTLMHCLTDRTEKSN